MIKRSIFFLCVSGMFFVITPFSEAKSFFPFEGEISFPQKKLFVEIKPEEATPLSINIDRISPTQYKTIVKIEDFKTALLDLSTVLESTVEFKKIQEQWGLSGYLTSKYTLVNHKPVKDLEGEIEIKGGSVYIRSLSVGKIFCKGSFQFIPPYKLNLKVHLFGVDMKDFIAFFAGHRKIASAGQVNGTIDISGSFDDIYLKGDLASYNGFVKKLDFDRIVLNAEGTYPVIYIADSNIAKSDGVTFNISGEVDLGDKVNFEKQIKLLRKKPLVKANEQNLEWTLKSNTDSAGKTEFKYLRKRKGNVDRLSEDGEAMLGVQRKMEF